MDLYQKLFYQFKVDEVGVMEEYTLRHTFLTGPFSIVHGNNVHHFRWQIMFEGQPDAAGSDLS